MANGITPRNVTRNQATFDRNLGKIFVWDNEYLDGETFLNNTGAELTLVGGEVVGRISANGKLVLMASASVDGSQVPIGINKTCAVIAIAGEITSSICVKGNVDQDLLIFNAPDTLDTVVNGARYRDLIASNTVGIVLKTFNEQTKFDN